MILVLIVLIFNLETFRYFFPDRLDAPCKFHFWLGVVQTLHYTFLIGITEVFMYNISFVQYYEICVVLHNTDG